MNLSRKPSVGEFPSRRFYAFVDEVEQIGEWPRGRTSYLFDCVDADRFERLGDLFEEEKPFAQIRILTTERRIREVAGEQPKPGDWWELEVAPHKKSEGLPTWHIQLADGSYLESSRGFTTKLRRLSGDDDGPPRKSVGAAAVVSTIVSDLFSMFSLNGLSALGPETILRGISQGDAVVIYDVGHASMVGIVDKDNKPLLLIDVGFPISYNRHTFPPRFHGLNLERSPPIILTHWDWDHMCAGLEMSGLKDLQWIVPNQRIGPGKIRLARILADKGKLFLWSSGSGIFPFGHVILCTGSGGDMNNTGLAVMVQLPQGNVLVPGDADYDLIPLPSGSCLKALVGSHHGGRFSGSCIEPSSAQLPMVFSYGLGNVYKHPREESLISHASVGWQIDQTAQGNWVKRGNRVLKP